MCCYLNDCIIHWTNFLYMFVYVGLLHDIGHGPFSHMFEREFLPKVINDSQWYVAHSLKRSPDMIQEIALNFSILALQSILLSSSLYTITCVQVSWVNVCKHDWPYGWYTSHRYWCTNAEKSKGNFLSQDCLASLIWPLLFETGNCDIIFSLH